ncbi:MAG: hypothetical protein K6U02_05000 [Firmicutes bacterium]|nr:hypothetical protein [Bacillota bacterium]
MREYKLPEKKIPRTRGHHQDWLDAIRQGKKAGSDFSYGAPLTEIAMLGVIYNLGEEQEATSDALRETLRAATWEGTDRKVFNLPVALSLMVFFALCAQCSSTLAVIRRETGSWRWPLVTFVYMTSLAYVAALATYQIGRLCLPL